MSRKILGLDIGDDFVSGVLIGSSLKGHVVESTARVPFGQQPDPDKALLDALGLLTKELDISGAVCNVSLPVSSFFFRTLQVPFREDKQIKQVLPFELESTLPHPVENLIIDFQKTGASKNQDSRLITAAVENTRIETLLETLSVFKLDPEIISIRGYPTALCLADTAGLPDNWIFCDLGQHTLTLFFAVRGRIVLARTALLPPAAATETVFEITRQIKRTLLAFEDTCGIAADPEILFVSGADRTNSELTEQIENDLEIPVRTADLGQNKSILALQEAEQIPAPETMQNALALAGLELAGLKGFNFRKGPFERKKQWVIHRKSIVTSSLVALLVAALAFTNILIDSYLLEKKVARLDREIVSIFKAALPDVKRIVDPLQQMQVKLQDIKKNLLLPSQSGKQIRAIDILNELSAGIPAKADVELTRVVISQESVLISGQTDTFNSVDDIQTRLEKTPLFSQVTISSANLEKSGNRINFKLKVLL